MGSHILDAADFSEIVNCFLRHLVGSAAALSPQDEVFAQYREVGVLLWRGFSVQEVH